MKNTYINDQNLVNYPFAEGQTLPFPRHAVAGLSVCFKGNYDGSQDISKATVSGVEIGNGQITLTLCVNDNEYIGKLVAKSGSVASFNNIYNARTHVHAMLEAGNLDGIEPMSAACDLRLDPSCVLRADGYHLDDTPYRYMTVDGEVYPVGECLHVQLEGALTVHTSTPDLWEPDAPEPSGLDWTTLCANVEGWLTAGSGSFSVAASSAGTYEMVTSVNGVAVRGTASGQAPVLCFMVVPEQTEPSTTNTMRRLKFGVVNGLTTDQLVDDDDDIGPNRVLRSFNSVMGSGTVLTVIGGPLVPNCYGPADQAQNPDVQETT